MSMDKYGVADLAEQQRAELAKIEVELQIRSSSGPALDKMASDIEAELVKRAAELRQALAEQ